jgi:hypothetical protein
MKIYWGRIIVGAIALELVQIVFVPLLSRVEMCSGWLCLPGSKEGLP